MLVYTMLKRGDEVTEKTFHIWRIIGRFYKDFSVLIGAIILLASVLLISNVFVVIVIDIKRLHVYKKMQKQSLPNVRDSSHSSR